MASEILSIPEEKLAEVILIIRVGMRALESTKGISDVTKRYLTIWCDEEQGYLDRITSD